MPHQNRLIVFTRVPELGKVKTRLNNYLKPASILALHKNLITHTLSQVSRSNIYTTVLHCAPDDQHDYIQSTCNRFEIESENQAEGDLGYKMQQAINKSFAAGIARVVIIGTDAPEISEDYISNAFTSLKKNDCVIGPAEDGGYVLIGFSVAVDSVFNNIDWGTDQVLHQTINKLENHSFKLLSTLWDVDRPDDVERLLKSETLKLIAQDI